MEVSKENKISLDIIQDYNLKLLSKYTCTEKRAKIGRRAQQNNYLIRMHTNSFTQGC